MKALTNIVTTIVTLAGAAQATWAIAQSPAEYPARPVRMIVPFAPGGSNDIMGRYLAQYLTERFGRQVVLDNRPGADGIIGTDIVARAAPDGYTLLVASAAHAVNGGTRKLPYHPVDSFAWAGTLGLGPSVLSVHASLPVNSVKELIAHGKANPGKLVMSSSGGYAHFSTELFHYMSGMKLIVVIYKGGFPALVDAMAAGNVVVANAPGAGVMETPAFSAFLPALAERLTGEPLKLPNIATWWCGKPGERDHVLALAPTVAHVGNGCSGILSQPVAVSGVAPGARHHSSPVVRPDLGLVGFNDAVDGGGFNIALLREQTVQSPHPHLHRV